MMSQSGLSSAGQPDPAEPQSSPAGAAGRSRSSADRLVLLLGRGLSAALLLAVGGSHLLLWFVGYGEIPRIGVSFLVNAAGALLLAAAVVVVRPRLLPVAAAMGSLFVTGTLGALTLALTVGLFGFVDALTTPLVPTTLVLELAGVVVLTATSVVASRLCRVR